MTKTPLLFTTKANTLKFLQNKLSKSKIEPLFDFTVLEWKQNSNNIVNSIFKKFINQKIIIRSSAKGEDSFDNSQAGSYLSILNINSNKKSEIKNSINSVNQSYLKKNNLHLLLCFIFIFNLSLTFANINNQISISQIKLENNQENIIIDLQQSSQLSPKIIELLERGIPIVFNLKIDLIKEEKYWFDKVIDQNNFVYQIKYFSLRKVFEVIDINGNKKIFEDEQEAIKNLLSDKEIIIKKYIHLNNTKLKIWVELDKKRLPKAIQADIFNKSWDAESNMIIFDMNKL